MIDLNVVVKTVHGYGKRMSSRIQVKLNFGIKEVFIINQSKELNNTPHSSIETVLDKRMQKWI